ncbi:MAG TPA: phosphate signaling complex protein PhoU [Urbifossiella sp.]|jgi:phosphate transport system protein|nr:phosphate signaling complex protein PhoU [Urbifossiella sp.]
MGKHLTRDLDDLQRRVTGMAARVEEAIYAALKALQTRDRNLAAEVIARDEAVDALENGIYEECLKIQALHQPVAIDLRRIATTFMVTTDLERMGDLAVDIAERADALAGLPDLLAAGPAADGVSLPDKLLGMTDTATAMVREALDAFVNLDGRQARRVVRMDDQVDRMHADIIRDLIARMKADPAAVEPGVSLFSAVRHLERIADHATNIAEDVVYLVDGDVIRHRPESVRAE